MIIIKNKKNDKNVAQVNGSGSKKIMKKTTEDY